MVCGLFQYQFNLYQFHHQSLQRNIYNNTPTINFQRLFRKLKTTLQVNNVVQTTKYQDISKPVNTLKYLLQHVQNIKLISEQVNYIYAACFSPVKSTFLKAIKTGYFSTFPNLTARNVDKYLITSVASAMGHLDQQYQGPRST